MQYYQFLIDALDLKPTDYLLDYGCGSGKLLAHLIDMPRAVLAVDTSQEQLTAARQKFTSHKNIEFRCLSSPNQLRDWQFDKILCHNVLECVSNKIDFINQFKPLLKAGGRLVLAHFDFDSACFFSFYKQFTRNLIHSYADAAFNWQGQIYADGQIGRKMPHLISRTNFKNYRWQLARLAEQDFKFGFYGYQMAEMLVDFGQKNFSVAELAAWRADLTAKASAGEYFFAIDLFICMLEI